MVTSMPMCASIASTHSTVTFGPSQPMGWILPTRFATLPATSPRCGPTRRQSGPRTSLRGSGHSARRRYPKLLTLPQAAGGADARFGLDLQPLLARIAGPQQAGTYLVGMRPLRGTQRHWIRMQVTDLSLTAVEEPGRVRFAVTSLATAHPVAGAEIRIEGLQDKDYRVLAQGITDVDGEFSYVPHDGGQASPRRIVVQKATDTLVLETAPGPQQYANGNWTQPNGSWLAWPFTKNPIGAREEKPRTLCHVFTDRPIYRPEEPVEIRGFVRRYLHGALAYSDSKGTLLVQGPNKQEWRYPGNAGRHQRLLPAFRRQDRGDRRLHGIVPARARRHATAPASRRKPTELPTFEVLLNNPAQVPLDTTFQIGLVARYYAGGVVTDRPIKWRVTQFPYTWNPPGREGFLFSSDARFSGEQAFRSTPVLQSDGKTDAGGAAQLTLDPTLEPTAQPRTYIVEATVTGDDGQQIRNVAHVPALPPFVLGVKMPRYLPHPGAIAADLLALDAEGKAARRPGHDRAPDQARLELRAAGQRLHPGHSEIRDPGDRPHTGGAARHQHRRGADAEFHRRPRPGSTSSR